MRRSRDSSIIPDEAHRNNMLDHKKGKKPIKNKTIGTIGKDLYPMENFGAFHQRLQKKKRKLLNARESRGLQ